MWIVLVSAVLYISFGHNVIVLGVNAVLVCILLIAPNNLMSDNIEYLYLISALLYVISIQMNNRWLILPKLVIDFMLLILIGVSIDYSWVFSSLVILDILELALFNQSKFRSHKNKYNILRSTTY